MKEKLVNLCPTICTIVCMILLALIMASIMLDNSILFSISFGFFVTRTCFVMLLTLLLRILGADGL